MKLLTATIAFICLCSVHAFAQSAESVIRKSQRVTSILEREGRLMHPAQLERVSRLLDNVMDELRGRGGGGGYGVVFQATCHVDDDTTFDWNVFIAGRIQGSSIRDLIEECAAMGRAMYRVSTSGIRDITIVGAVPRGFRGGTCHIDDDPTFDFDVMVIGQLAGPDLTAITNDCKAIATSIYGSKGSSGVKDFRTY